MELLMVITNKIYVKAIAFHSKSVPEWNKCQQNEISVYLITTL